MTRWMVVWVFLSCSAHAALVESASCELTYTPSGEVVASESYDHFPEAMCVDRPVPVHIQVSVAGPYPDFQSFGHVLYLAPPPGMAVLVRNWTMLPPECELLGGCYEWRAHGRYLLTGVTGVLITGGSGTGQIRSSRDVWSGGVEGPIHFDRTFEITKEPPAVFTYGTPFNVAFLMSAEITAQAESVPPDQAYFYGGEAWQWVVDNENAQITLVEPIPEPGTGLLIAIGLIALARRGRRTDGA